MKDKANGIKVNMLQMNDVKTKSFAFGVSFILSELLYLAIVLNVYEVLGLQDLGVNPIIFVVAGTLAVTVFTAGYSYSGRSLIIIAAILIVILGILFNDYFRHGINIVLDQIAVIRTEKTSLIQTRFDRGDSEQATANVFSVFLSVLFAAIATLISFEGGKWTLLLVPIMITVGLLLQVSSAGIGIAFLVIVLLVITAGKYLLQADAYSGVRSMPQSLVLVFILLTFSILSTTFITGGFISDDSRIGSFIEEKIHRLRYEGNENIMPEGDLINVKPFEPTGRTNLIINMTYPETTYLRGFVGEKYENGKWTELSEDFYSDNSDLFYWLHQDGFYVQSQNAAANSLVNGAHTETMDIVNVSACKRYKYTPYSLYQNGTYVTDERLIGDATVFGGKDNSGTNIDYIPNTIYQSYIVQQKLSKNQTESDELKKYLDDESQYRELAYTYYLDVPESVEEIFAGLLGEKQKAAYSDAKKRILECLDSNVKYRADVESNRKDELVEWFLTNRKAGYSVHYAATTTLMLRYLGIPARYVEGYVITSDNVEEIEAGIRFDVSEKMAHAWAEYYLDGIGWIPFETTPGYRNTQMYAPGSEVVSEDADSNNGSGVIGDNIEGMDTEEDRRVNDDAPFDNPINNWVSIFAFRKIILPVLLSILLLVLLIIILLRRIKLNKFLKTFKSYDVRKGIINSFAYAGFIVSKMLPEMNQSFPGDCRDEIKKVLREDGLYDEVLAIRNEAIYSSKPLTEENLNKVLLFKDIVLNNYKGTRNVFLMIYDRLILCIY